MSRARHIYRLLSEPLQLVVCVLAYAGLAKISFFILAGSDHADAQPPVWLPAGLALVMALKWGARALPAILMGSLLGQKWTIVATGTGPAWGIALLLIAAETGQAYLAAYLVKRWCESNDPFRTVRDVLVFLAVSSVACGVSTLAAVVALSVRQVTLWETTWYLSDLLGVFLIAPLILTWPQFPRLANSPWRAVEFGSLVLANWAAAWSVFAGWSPTFDRYDPVAVLSLPLILWCAVRFQQFGVVLVILLVSVVAIYGTVHDYGPFAGDSTIPSMLMLQLFIGISLVTGLILSTSLSERSRSERELRLAEARLEEALSAGNVGLWDWDLRTNEVFYSTQFKIQLGYPPDADWRSYMEWETRVHPDDKDAALQRVRDYLSGRATTYVSIFRLRHRNGSYRWIQSQGRGEWDENGRPVGMFGVHVDITERVMHMEELERSNLELQQFAYAVSHDLQEPLRSIASFTQLLQRKHAQQFDEESALWFDSVINAAKRMKSLIEDLLRYTRLDGSVVPFEEVVMTEIVDEVRANLAGVIEETKASVRVDGELPVVVADRVQLVQLLQNLVSNSLKFRSDEHPRVRIRCCESTGEWVFCVEDNGIGIDAQYHDRIFDVFKRLHHRREHPGNGMGLAICRRIVHRHGGRIWVESSRGKGSQFFFTLPYAPNDESSDKPSDTRRVA